MKLKELESKYEELGKEIERLKNKNELPKSWEELKTISGYYVTNNSVIMNATKNDATKVVQNTFKTEAQAKASIALAQLSQLMAVYNNGWEADWTTRYEIKYALSYVNNELARTLVSLTKKFLVFKTDELRSKFLENFRDLIEEAKPLL